MSQQISTVVYTAGCFKPTGPKVKLVVGQERKVFTAHCELLSRHSPVFRSALTGPWTEATTRTLELPDSDPDVVDVFLLWAYKGYLLGPMFAFELYVFSDKYQIPLLKIDAAHTLYWHWTSWNHASKKQIVVQEAVPEAETVQFAIDNLPQTNRILQLLRVVVNLWDGQGVEYQEWVQMRLARTRLFQTGPYGPVDRIAKEHIYTADAKHKGSFINCPRAATTTLKACYNCLWLAGEKPWLVNDEN